VGSVLSDATAATIASPSKQEAKEMMKKTKDTFMPDLYPLLIQDKRSEGHPDSDPCFDVSPIWNDNARTRKGQKLYLGIDSMFCSLSQKDWIKEVSKQSIKCMRDTVVDHTAICERREVHQPFVKIMQGLEEKLDLLTFSHEGLSAYKKDWSRDSIKPLAETLEEIERILCRQGLLLSFDVRLPKATEFSESRKSCDQTFRKADLRASHRISVLHRFGQAHPLGPCDFICFH
jgi:hypothetical protein